MCSTNDLKNNNEQLHNLILSLRNAQGGQANPSQTNVSKLIHKELPDLTILATLYVAFNSDIVTHFAASNELQFSNDGSIRRI